jgi:hypothetical protein
MDQNSAAFACRFGMLHTPRLAAEIAIFHKLPLQASTFYIDIRLQLPGRENERSTP